MKTLIKLLITLTSTVLSYQRDTLRKLVTMMLIKTMTKSTLASPVTSWSTSQVEFTRAKVNGSLSSSIMSPQLSKSLISPKPWVTCTVAQKPKSRCTKRDSLLPRKRSKEHRRNVLDLLNNKHSKRKRPRLKVERVRKLKNNKKKRNQNKRSHKFKNQRKSQTSSTLYSSQQQFLQRFLVHLCLDRLNSETSIA